MKIIRKVSIVTFFLPESIICGTNDVCWMMIRVALYCIVLNCISLYCIVRQRIDFLYIRLFSTTLRKLLGLKQGEYKWCAEIFFQLRNLGDLPKKEDATYFSKDKGDFFAPKMGVMFSKDFANFAKEEIRMFSN